MNRVVVLRALGLGDALTGVPALRGLRRRYPDSTLTLLAPAGIGSWLRDLGLADEALDVRGLSSVLPVDRPADESGLTAVNLHGSGPQSHALLRSLAPARMVAYAAGGLDGPEWDAGEHEVDRWCRLVRSDGGECSPADLLLDQRAVMYLGSSAPGRPLETRRPGEHVVVHPGAAFAARRWPVRRWAVVVRRLVNEGTQVVLTGSAAEQEACRQIAALVPSPQVVDLSGRSSLPELAALVASARLLLCGDTGVAHLATAVGTRSVLLFGPVSPRLWGPAVQGERHTVLWHGQEERPGDPHGERPDPALLAIEPDEVLAAAATQLAAQVPA